MLSPMSMSEMSRFVDSPRAEVAKRPSKKRKDSTQPPPVCKICGDRAESRHYGVFACNGCKGFFRRSVWNNRKYICRHRDDCKIVKEQRNKCRSCRLKTCLAVGMNPKAVQYERDGASVNMKIEDRSDKPGSKLLKASTSECSQQTEAAYIEQGGGLIMQEAAHSLSPLPEQLDQAALLVQIYRRVVSRVDPPESFTGGKDIPFHIALRHPSLVTRRKEIRLTAERIATEEDILDECRRQFVLSVDWINAIPEYQQLPEDVQYTIAKRRITEFAWFFQAWNAIITGCEGMCFLNGSYFPADPKLQILPDIKGANRLFRQNLLAPLKEMNFDETELCIVQALVLFTPDLSDLNDVTKAYLRKTCEKYTGILFEYCRTRFAKFLNDQMAESEAACRVAQIMLLIATMTKINLLCCDGMLCMDLLNICDWDGLTRQIYESQRHIGLEQAHVSRHPMLPTRLASFNDGTFQG